MRGLTQPALAQWPQLVLTNLADFHGHSALQGAGASAEDDDGIAVTAFRGPDQHDLVLSRDLEPANQDRPSRY